MTFEPGEGPLTEDEAKLAVAAEEPEDEDTEPPPEPIEDALDDASKNVEGEPE